MDIYYPLRFYYLILKNIFFIASMLSHSTQELSCLSEVVTYSLSMRFCFGFTAASTEFTKLLITALVFLFAAARINVFVCYRITLAYFL